MIGTTGLFNGKEVLTAVPASGAIFDKAGNIAATTQSNNTVTMNDNRIVIEKDYTFYTSTTSDITMVPVGPGTAAYPSNILMNWRKSSWSNMMNLFSIDAAGNTTENREVQIMNNGADSLSVLLAIVNVSESYVKPASA